MLPACKSLNKTQADTGKNNTSLQKIIADFRTNNTMTGALLDGVLAGDAGIVMSKKADDEAAEIEKMITGSDVKRSGDGIAINFASGLYFANNSIKIEDSTKANLEKLATFFVNNPNTKILIEGHSSKDPNNPRQSEDKSKRLSQQRAVVVSRFLQSKGVSANRITMRWYGSAQPKYSNDSQANRVKNSRVEIGLIPEETYRKLMQAGG